MSVSSISADRHPISGLPIRALAFVGKDGTVKYVRPVLGASQPGGEGTGSGSTGTGGSGGTGDGTGSTGGSGTGGGSGSTGGGSGTGSGSTETSETDPAVLAQRLKEANDESAARRHKAKELEAANAELAAKLKEFQDKDKSELERAQGDLETTKKQLDQANETIMQLRIQNAFLGSNKHQWQSAEAAQRLADLSDVKIDDDGKVTGLDKALDKLAKDHPYLLKPTDNGGQGGGKNGSSGAPAGSTGKGNETRDSRAAIAARFPAAARRR